MYQDVQTQLIIDQLLFWIFGNISTNILGSSKNVNLCIIFMLEIFSHITQAFYQCLKIIFELNFNQMSRMFDISVSSENP